MPVARVPCQANGCSLIHLCRTLAGLGCLKLSHQSSYPSKSLTIPKEQGKQDQGHCPRGNGSSHTWKPEANLREDSDPPRPTKWAQPDDQQKSLWQAKAQWSDAITISRRKVLNNYITKTKILYTKSIFFKQKVTVRISLLLKIVCSQSISSNSR